MFWFLVMVTINVSGTVLISTQYPSTPAVNNKESCEEIGKKIADEIQLENGTKNAQVFWLCKNVPYETVVKTLKPI